MRKTYDASMVSSKYNAKVRFNATCLSLRFLMVWVFCSGIMGLSGCAHQGMGNSTLTHNNQGCGAMCGEDHIYAQYASMIKNTIEENFYVNDTYTCQYAYMSPLPSHGPRLMGGQTHYHYLCTPDNPPQPSETGPESYGPVYFRASLSTAAYAKPIMKIKIEAYQVIKTYIKTLVGDNIPQPGLTSAVKMDPSIGG